MLCIWPLCSSRGNILLIASRREDNKKTYSISFMWSSRFDISFRWVLPSYVPVMANFTNAYTKWNLFFIVISMLLLEFRNNKTVNANEMFHIFFFLVHSHTLIFHSVRLSLSHSKLRFNNLHLRNQITQHQVQLISHMNLLKIDTIENYVGLAILQLKKLQFICK